MAKFALIPSRLRAVRSRLKELLGSRVVTVSWRLSLHMSAPKSFVHKRQVVLLNPSAGLTDGVAPPPPPLLLLLLSKYIRLSYQMRRHPSRVSALARHPVAVSRCPALCVKQGMVQYYRVCDACMQDVVARCLAGRLIGAAIAASTFPSRLASMVVGVSLGYRAAACRTV
jgi:hypothetical protein